MAYFLSLDQGTTSSRAVIIDECAQVKGMGQHQISQYYPQNGWVEHDPEQIWSTMLQACFDAFHQAKLRASDIAGIGITNQRETTVIWDKKNHKPIYPAIVWQDRRTASVCERLRLAGKETEITQKTGLLLDAYFSATKIQWILNHVPGAKARAAAGELCFGTIETWLLWCMTQGRSHLTDATNASRTLLFNIHTQEWDKDLLTLFDIPSQILPQVVDNYGHFGVADAHLLGAELPICAMAGDQQSAAFGQACFDKGMAKTTFGTGGFLLVNTGEKPVFSSHQLLTTIQYRLPGQLAYGVEGSIFIAGAAIQWLRDNLRLIQHSSDIQTLADEVENSGGVCFVPALTGLGAPYWNPHARGLISGLTRDTRPGHLAQATLDAVCYQTRDLLATMAEDGLILTTLRVDGGMTVNDRFLQRLSDILGVSVQRPRSVETTAQGVAFLTGLALGIYRSLDDIRECWQPDHLFEPRAVDNEVIEEGYRLWCYWVKQMNEMSSLQGQ